MVDDLYVFLLKGQYVYTQHVSCVSAEALKEVAEITAQLQSSLIRLENFQKLTELQRDLIGIENLTAPGRVRVMFYLMYSQELTGCFSCVETKILCIHKGLLLNSTNTTGLSEQMLVLENNLLFNI